jgi:dipeptidyl aminopeptidase/acylaminoacyl peptidase
MLRSYCAALAALVGVGCTSLLTGASAQTENAPAVELPPAERFARSPEFWGAAMSPNGRFLAGIQRVELGQMLVVIDLSTGERAALQLARRDTASAIDWVQWKDDTRLVFGARQLGLISRVFAIDRDGSHPVQMFQGEMYRLASDYAPIHLIDIQARDPEHVLLGAYGQRGYTVYRANLESGRVRSLGDAGWFTAVIYVDGAGEQAMRVDLLRNGSGYQIFRRAARGGWTLAHEVRRSTIAQNRDFFPLGPGPGPSQVYVAARPQGREFQAIYLYNTATGELGEPVFQHESADAAIAWLDPNNNSIIVGCGETQRWQCRATSPTIQRHVDALTTYFDGRADFSLTGVSQDENRWLIYGNGPTIPGAYFVYDLASAEITLVSATQPQLSSLDLAPMRVVEYAGRDGAGLWGYLTEPLGRAGPHPLVVMPHGGPEMRDSYAYDPYVQFLASRGYAVFQPNFRGSEGSGRTFVEAGHRQWGRRMQDDVTDGVRHLIDTGAVARDRVCIVGMSYGGYAALAGATLTPDLYKCVIAVAGVSDLLEILETERRDEGRRSTTYAYWLRLIGDPVADAAELRAVSPRLLADRVQAPVLLMHGTADGIVPINQSEMMRDALQRAGKPVEFIQFEREGHSWMHWTQPDRLRLFGETERFLAAHIGAP